MNTELIIYTAIASVLLLFVSLLYVHQDKLRTLLNRLKAPATPAIPAAQFEQLQARLGFTSDVVLHIAASLAQPSNHRLAQAIVSEAQKRHIPINPVHDFKNLEGYGLTGVVDGRIIALGSHQLMTELGIKTQVNHQQLADSQAVNTLVLYVSVNSYLAGIITINDVLNTSF